MSDVIHRALAGALLCLSGLAFMACGGALPRPSAAAVSAEDYVEVPFAPRVPPVEFVPPRPGKEAVWVDGSWQWAGNRYGWRYGSWVAPPPGIRRAPWAVVRRSGDGQLFFAPASWKDASGKTVDDRSFATTLGPAARARTRLGAPPPTRLSPDGAGRAGRRPAELDRGGGGNDGNGGDGEGDWYEDEGNE